MTEQDLEKIHEWRSFTGQVIATSGSFLEITLNQVNVMNEKEYSEKTRKEVIFKLKEDLEKEGFETSWQDPFFVWIQGEPLQRELSNYDAGDKFYIYNLQFPKVAPFDTATITIHADSQFISFAMTFYFCTVLENLLEADEFSEIFDRHDNDWFLKLTDYFRDIADRFPLQWDIEYDEFIEDSLWGNFPFESSNDIISLMRGIKKFCQE